jgi:hypothetical protein
MHFPPGIEDIPHLIFTMKVPMESAPPVIQPEMRDTLIAKPAIIKMKAVEEMIKWMSGV